MITATQDNFTVKRHDSYTDIIPDPRVALSGAELFDIVHELKARYPVIVVARSESGDFVIRLHGRICDEALHELETGDLFPALPAPGEYAPREQPEVLFVQDGLAVIDPQHRLPIANLLATAKDLSEKLLFQISISLQDEYLGFVSSRHGGTYPDAAFGGRLRDLLQPKYTFTADPVIGGVGPDGLINLMFDCPRGVVTDLTPLHGLPGLAEEPPCIDIPDAGLPGPARIHFFTRYDVQDIAGLWEVAVKAILALGVFPTGQFILQHDDRTRTVYAPPALSVR